MRPDEGPELEHDLGMAVQRDRSHWPAPTPARNVGPHGSGARRPEADETRRRQRLAPDAEEVAERECRAAPHFDHAGRLERPRRV